MTACMRRQKLACAPCQRAALLLVPGMLLLLLAAQPRATPQPQPLAARTARSVSAAGDDSGGASGGGSCPPLPRIPEGCVEVQHACVDQGTFVLHGAGYQPDAVSGKAAVALPTWRAAARAHFPYPAAQSNPDYVKLPGLPEPAAFTFRPVSAYEPSPDIASPQVGRWAHASLPPLSTCRHLSAPDARRRRRASSPLPAPPLLQWSCQVPVVLQAGWPFNYWHGLANAAAWLYDRLTVPGGPLAQRAVVSVSTPWALGLPPWLRTQLQPMARQPVQTLAE